MGDNESESKSIIVNKCSTDVDESECVINKHKDTTSEIEYDEYPVIYDVTIYFNVSKCERNILNILNKRAWILQNMNTIRLLKDIDTYAARSGTRIFRTPREVKQDGQGWYHAIERKHCRSGRQVDFHSSIFSQYHRLPNP